MISSYCTSSPGVISSHSVILFAHHVASIVLLGDSAGTFSLVSKFQFRSIEFFHLFALYAIQVNMH